MNEYIPILVALIAGPVTVFVTTRLSKRRVEADNAKTVTDIAMSLIEPLKAEIDELKAALRASENEKHLLMQWAATLVEHLVKVGERPQTFDEFKQQNGHRP